MSQLETVLHPWVGPWSVDSLCNCCLFLVCWQDVSVNWRSVNIEEREVFSLSSPSLGVSFKAFLLHLLWGTFLSFVTPSCHFSSFLLDLLCVFFPACLRICPSSLKRLFRVECQESHCSHLIISGTGRTCGSVGDQPRLIFDPDVHRICVTPTDFDMSPPWNFDVAGPPKLTLFPKE